MRSFFLKKRRSGSASQRLISAVCILIIAAGALYTLSWYAERKRILTTSEQYSAMYDPATPSPVPSEPATVSPTAEATPSPIPTVAPTDEPLPEVIDLPIATPDSETIVFSMPTSPPVQESFSALLDVNEETVGYLRIASIVDLPVVQRENNNDFYLNHNFAGEESPEGALFLDGLNRLVPEDDCLIVYGHNMNNGTMFGNLRSYLNKDFFRSHAEVSFDTIYENRTYIPFAAFNASMDSQGRNSFDLRRFVLDPAQFEDFVASLKSHSVFHVPLDVTYGDRILLLVTCDYSNNDGRFILALRELRSGESLVEAAAKVGQALPR